MYIYICLTTILEFYQKSLYFYYFYNQIYDKTQFTGLQ